MITIQVYPNPSNGVITIEWNTEEFTPSTLEVFNAIGVRCKQLQILPEQGKFTVNLGNVPVGVYSIQLLALDGQRKQQKIVISK